MPNWLGDLATWFAAIAGIVFAAETRCRQNRLEDRERGDKRSRYARSVFAHIGLIEEGLPPPRDQPDLDQLVTVTVANNSTGRIYGVEVQVFSPQKDLLGEGPPLYILGPIQRAPVKVQCPAAVRGSCSVRVEFTDADDVRWYRIGEEAPVEIGAPTGRRSLRAAGAGRRPACRGRS